MIALGFLAVLVQQPDTAKADTARRTVLPALEVRVTRAGETTSRLPMAVGVLGGEKVRRAQLTSGLDESLSRLPGVVVLNRYNYSLDQRVSLRGAGSRANFGLRGIKVLIDGVPQTLPDGQSQLSNLELGLVDRVEVLTGSAGALYGNASGGVLAFRTETPLLPWEARVRVTGGSFGTTKWQGVLGAQQGMARGLVSLSQLVTDGFRQHGRAKIWQFQGKGDITLGQSTLGASFLASDAPRAENPGALTAAEYAAKRDSAAANNILRGADKDVTQQQLALRYRWSNGNGAELEATAFGLKRDLKNPLATPPPPPTGAALGTYNTIDRKVGGVRVAGTLPLHSVPLRVTAGFDAQKMRDDRQNQRSNAGQPTGQLLADQRETVSEVGPFAQVHWDASDRVLILGALRWDRLTFRVTDHLLTDGVDNSGTRRMEDASGSVGVSVGVGGSATLYSNVSSSFESPTTTELVNTQNGTAGFNTTLAPQRTMSVEVGSRGSWSRLDYSVALYTNRVTDAIVQVREADGRAFFANAGRVRNRGLEAGLGVEPIAGVRLQTAYAFSDFRFRDYQIPNGATTDTLDGKRLPGVPKHFLRGTLTVSRGPVVVDVDQLVTSQVFADDKNTQKAEGWAITSVRVSGTARIGELRFEPFAALNNLFGKKYVGSVNLNGTFGRVLEPAPGRNGYLGMEVGWGKR